MVSLGHPRTACITGGRLLRSIPQQQRPPPPQATGALNNDINVSEFDPLAAGASGRNLLARAFSSQQDDAVGVGQDFNVNDIKIELSNPLEKPGATTGTFGC